MSTPKNMSVSKQRTARPGAFRRRDATGHLEPKYAADLHAKSGKDAKGNDPAFIGGRARSTDELAESLGEEFVESATSAESTAERSPNDDIVTEESGGPFVVTNAKIEFAKGTDASNPEDSTREPFPKSSSVWAGFR
jgi:hypothetical protein